MLTQENNKQTETQSEFSEMELQADVVTVNEESAPPADDVLLELRNLKKHFRRLIQCCC